MKIDKFRPTAVPLVTIDPFFSIWSFKDKLYEDYTRHWTGKKNSMSGFLKIDGEWHKFMGNISQSAEIYSNEPEVMEQIDLKILPLTTIYTFRYEDIVLKVEFMSPLLPDRIDIMSRPVSYISYSITAEKKHDILFYFDINSEVTVNDTYEKVKFDKTDYSIYCGKGNKDVLSMSGDGVCIDWGYLHLAAPEHEYVIMDTEQKKEWFTWDKNIERDEDSAVNRGYPALGCMRNIEVSKEKPCCGRIYVGYDDIHSIEYMGEYADAYWKKDGQCFDEMMKGAMEEYDEIKELADDFNQQLISDASKESEKYVDMLSLAYRQVVAAHKLVYHNGEVLFFSKECFSNGCIATVDVTFPSQPLFLKYNPDLVCAMIEPIFKYASSSDWDFDFAPHDVGQYPLANGQVYGYNPKTRDMDFGQQMPVEESGNMLLIAAAVCHVKNDYSFAEKHKDLLGKWANFLLNFGYDPGEQLCTDDFMGRLAHNCNLSIKAILGIAAWGKCLEQMGRADESRKFISKAKEMASEWKKNAWDGKNYRLAFDKPGTWSLKYNLVWDRLLNLNIFDKDIAQTESKFYMTKLDKYGMPLDSRDHIGKTDWQMISSAICENEEYKKEIIARIWDFICNTDRRVPISDYYNTENSRFINFQNRTTLGALYIHLLFN